MAVSIDLDIPAEWPRRTLEHIGMKKQEAGQPNVAVRKNAEFFAGNTWIPKIGNIMTLGLELPAWLTPIRVGEFVYQKPGLSSHSRKS